MTRPDGTVAEVESYIQTMGKKKRLYYGVEIDEDGYVADQPDKKGPRLKTTPSSN